MISMILGLLLVVIVVRLVISILVNPGLLLRIVLGFALLALASVVALVLTIGQFVSRYGSHAGVSMPGVTVNPMGVHVHSGTGESVRVTPFGVEVNGRTTRTEPHVTRHVQSATGDEEAYVLEGLSEVGPAPLGFWKGGYFHEGVAADPSPGVDADTPIHRNRTEAERQTDAEFRRVFEHYLESPLPAAVATESTAQAEAPEAPTAPVAVAQPQRLLSDHFDPDVYQSEGAAVRGLTSQVGKLLDSLTYARRAPATIYIKGNIDQPLVREMWNVLNKDFPFAAVSCTESAVRVADETVILAAWVEEQERAQAPAPAAAVTGPAKVLRMDAIGKGGKISRSARFLDKPWVDDFATFASNNRGRTWVMAMSREAAVSAAEAEQQALNDAVAQLEPRVRDRMAYHARGAVDSVLQRQIRAGLESSGMIADRFVQRFERPYGEIWQVGLLIDASSKKIAGLADKCDRVLAAQQRTFRQTVLSIAGLVALVCVVYIFLNSVTKGYFVWSLRAAALAILAGGIFLVLFLSHNDPAIEGFLR
jgi:hypothetical protein